MHAVDTPRPEQRALQGPHAYPPEGKPEQLAVTRQNRVPVIPNKAHLHVGTEEFPLSCNRHYSLIVAQLPKNSLGAVESNAFIGFRLGR